MVLNLAINKIHFSLEFIEEIASKVQLARQLQAAKQKSIFNNPALYKYVASL